MWKDEEVEVGDLEMIEHQNDTDNSFDDFDDQGYQMGSSGYRSTSSRGHFLSGFKCVCLQLGAVFALGIGACAMAYVFVPDFGVVPNWMAGSTTNNHHQGNNDDGDFTGDGFTGTVDPSSIIDHSSAYTVILQVPVATVEADVIVYEHVTTRTPIMTILPYDTQQDSVFGISFRTKPTNSHGAPHVLEHSVLAGSKKYPLKDPFTQVLKGSLNTFVNAMTWKDLTAYVCASRNDVDMKNLMSVYMDAVFQPLVVEDQGKWIFRQEGWRIELNDNDTNNSSSSSKNNKNNEKKGEPEFNGVVLSEMKGVMSNPEEVLVEHMEAHLFPNTTYRFNSGGNPLDIPNLTHEELKQFYKTFYHPSNAQVFFYGTKTSAKNCLQQMDEYLRTYSYNKDVRNQSKIELQPLLQLPNSKHRIPFEAETEDEPHKLMMSWMISKDGSMDDHFQRENRMTYAVLNELLNNERYGALFLALQNSGLVGSIEGDIDISQLQWTFDVLVSNVAGDQADTVEQFIRDTLQNIAKNGFHQEDVESAINTVEFDYKDISSQNNPRGIMIWMNIMQTYKFDLEPLTGFLSFEKDLHELKAFVKKHGSQIFQGIIQNNIIDNSHAVVAELYPDPTLAEKNTADESNRIAEIQKSEQYVILLEEADALAEIQEKEDDPQLIASIPSVTVADLEKEQYEPPIIVAEDREGSGVTALVHEVASSFGIIYADFGVDISAIAFDDIILLPLLGNLMVDGGTKKYDATKIAREIGSHTGGIENLIFIHSILGHNVTEQYQVPSGDHFHSKLFLRGSASKEKSEKLFELFSEIMFNARLDDKERALGFLRDRVASFERAISTGGTGYALQRLNARYYPAEAIQEMYRGVSSLPKWRELLTQAEDDWPTLQARLQTMRGIIAKSNRKGMVLNLTGEKDVLKYCSPISTRFLTRHLPDRSGEMPLPNFSTEPHPWLHQAMERMAKESPTRNEGVVSSASVNFVGAGAPFYKPGEDISGAATVVTQFVEYNNFMLEIRERRGAYGAFASLDKSGLLAFMTFRDPNLEETLKVFEAVPTYLVEEMKKASTAIPLINSAIIGTIGSLDGPAPQPSTSGWESMLRWLIGYTPKIRQKWRDDILATTNNDFLEYAKRLESWKPTLGISAPKAALVEKEKSLNLTLIDLL